MGVLDSKETPKQKVVRMNLGDSLAMLGLPHAHVIHEADPDTKVARLILTPEASWIERSSCPAAPS